MQKIVQFTYMSKEASNFWTRLINVLYGIGWIGVLIAVGLTYVITKPYTYVDNTKSKVSCYGEGGTYSFEKIQDYIYDVPNWYDLNLDTIEDKAHYTCIKVAENNLQYSNDKKTVWSEVDQNWYPNTQENRSLLTGEPNKQPKEFIYQINEVETTNGKWENVVMWMLGVLIALSIALDLIRSTLLYLTTGRKIKASDFVLFKIFGQLEVK